MTTNDRIKFYGIAIANIIYGILYPYLMYGPILIDIVMFRFIKYSGLSLGMLLIWGSIMACVGLIVASIGLFLTASWGRWLTIISSALSIAVMAMDFGLKIRRILFDGAFCHFSLFEIRSYTYQIGYPIVAIMILTYGIWKNKPR